MEVFIKIEVKDNNVEQALRDLKRKLPEFIKSYPVKKKDLISAINHNGKNLKKISSVVHPLIRKKMKLFLEEIFYMD